MKIDFINALVALAISALLAWGAYSITSVEELKMYVAIVTFVALAVSGICAFAVKTNGSRSVVVMRATSGVFFFVLILVNGVFVWFDFSKPLYIILNALIVLLLLVINRAVVRTRM